MLLFWIALYGAVFSVSDRLAALGREGTLFAVALMVSYPVCLIGWLVKSGRHRVLGLSVPVITDRQSSGLLLCLLVLPVFNLATVSSWKMDGVQAVTLICVSVAEELFFRGFLLHHLSRKIGDASPWISSCVFALAHVVNLACAVTAESMLLQVLCAFAVGIYYSAVVLRFGSILPCMAAHVLVNLSAGTSLSRPSAMETAGLLLCGAVYFRCGARLLRQTNITCEETEK